jgi:flagellar basal-body rod protein FlgG
VTQDGYEVNGDAGPITATGANTSILPSGQVNSGGIGVGSIQTVKIDQPDQLEAVGNSRFKLPRNGIATPTDTQLVPQSLEMANISVVSSMVDLIAAHRGFEAYTKVAQTIDQLNQDAITSVGRRR